MTYYDTINEINKLREFQQIENIISRIVTDNDFRKLPAIRRYGTDIDLLFLVYYR